MNLRFDNLTPRQREMVQTPVRVLWVGAGTKTGKSAAEYAKHAGMLLENKRTCWVGPWSEQTYFSYFQIKKILQPYIDEGFVKANDSNAHFITANGGEFTRKTGDNPDAIYGGGYDHVTIDEASRQTLESFTAAQTTVSATGGTIHCMFNLDHGSANWSIKNLLRVKSMTEQERAESGEDFMIFPTGGEGLVSVEEIERIRKSGMPEPIFQALFNAQIPDTDLSLFHNLPFIFQGGLPPVEPERGHFYVAGMDVARKQNWTGITVIDTTAKRVVQAARFHEVSWTLQYAKAKAIYDKWNCGKLVVDATGLGDPIEEELYKLGINVEGFIFGEKSRTQLIEQLVIACDAKDFTVCVSPEFDVLRAELESFEVLLDPKNGKVKYGVSSGHDDMAFSLMLAWHAHLQGGGAPVKFVRVVTEEEVASRDWSAM